MSADFRCKFSINSNKHPDPDMEWSIGTWYLCAVSQNMRTECSGNSRDRKCCPLWKQLKEEGA